MATATKGNGNGNGTGNSHRGNGNGHSRISGNGHHGNGGNGGNGHNGSRKANGKPGKKPNVAALTLLAIDWESKRTEAKRLYSEADEIERKIIDRLGVGNSFTMKGTGRTVIANDNFRDSSGNAKTVSFKPCGVKAVEVKIMGGARTVTVADDDDE